jgi:effector-binding domain-containing protein
MRWQNKPMDKIYHIYARGKCVYHSIHEEEFSVVWNTLKNFVSIANTEYNVCDLSYEELTLNSEMVRDSSH